MDVEVLTIGDELLLGFTVDTNAAHLARELAAAGVRVARRATVGDEAAEIAAGVREALERTGAVITTGGLGPTSDDLTKPAIAELFGRTMRLDEGILARLRLRWKERGWPGELPAPNRQQALIPDGARVLENRHGSAPGIWMEDGSGRWVAMLPGVPREMRGMLADTLLPIVRERVGADADVVQSRTLRTTGIGESNLAERLGDLARGFPDLPLAYLPSWSGTDLRLTARGMREADARRALDEAEVALRGRVGQFIYGEGSDDLAAVVLDACRARGLHVAVGESCTGGLLAARLTAIPGASDVVRGGVVAYDNRVKRELLEVSGDDLEAHGAVSELVARQMASGARGRLGAEVGLGVTGIAGPGGGTTEKPVGTVCIAADLNGDVSSQRTVFVGDREEVRQRSAQAALDMVRRALNARR